MLGQRDLPVAENKRIGHVRTRLVAAARLEGWVVARLLEETSEGLVEMHQGLLQTNAGDLFEPRRFVIVLEKRQLGRQVLVVDPLLPFEKGRRTSL